jgi:thioredoxin-related protein
MYFSPDCIFSQKQTETIINNIGKFNNVRFYLLTPFPYKKVKAFYNQYKLFKHNNITLAGDNELNFARQFDVKSYPWLVIYNKNRQLVKIISGSVEANTMLEIINK